MKSRLFWLWLVCAAASSVQAQEPGVQAGPDSAEAAPAPSPLNELEAQRAVLDARVESLTAASAASRSTGPLIGMGVSAVVFSSLVLASSTRGRHTGEDPDVILLSYTPLPALALAASWLTLGIRNHRQRARAAQLSDLRMQRMRLSASIEALQCMPPACDPSTLRAQELAAISARLDALSRQSTETSLWLPTTVAATTGLGMVGSFAAVTVMVFGNLGSFLANDDDEATGPFNMDRARAFAMAGLGFSSLFMASSGWLFHSLRTRSLVKYEAKALRVRQRELSQHRQAE